MKLDHNYEDNWAKVELFRWQYGKLPLDDYRPLDVSVGLSNMASAIENYMETGKGGMPTPLNVAEVLKFCAKRIK